MGRLIEVVALCVLPAVLVACRTMPTPSLSATGPMPIPAGGTIVIRNGTVIDGTGAEPMANGLVAIQGSEIVAVGPETQYEIPRDAEVIDAQGGSILPGFIDAHTHILGNASITPVGLKPWLQAGVTTVRDLGSRYGKSTPSLSIEELKQRLRAYGNEVPTVVIAGPIMTAPGGYPVPVWGSHLAFEVANVDEARQGAELLLADGADAIKIAIDSGTPAKPFPVLSVEQVKAITEVAHRKGTRVSAHVMRLAEAQLAVEGGVDDLAHMILFGKMPDELIRQMVDQDISLVPTLVAEDGLASRLGLDDEQGKQFLEPRLDNLRRYLAAGGRVAMGSDFGNPGIPAGMPLPELQRMVEFGMTPMQVIVASTNHAAQVCNLGRRLGTLEVGKQADIVVVRGNPIEDIRAMKEAFIVIKNGEVVVRIGMAP